MTKNNKIIPLGIVFLAMAFSACKAPYIATKTENRSVPTSYAGSQDTINSASIVWRTFFDDPYLTALIDTALKNNQELNIIMQEIQLASNDVRTRKGEYMPIVSIGAGAGIDKVGRYTRNGALEATTEIEPGKEFPDPLPDFGVAAYANWELDIWKKLRNAKKAAVARYFATIQGKNFMVTNLIAEISDAYYELLALDNELQIVRQNISIQENALGVVKLQKQATRVTELAVQRFEAQALNTRELQYAIQQNIIEAENRINFLLGRFPQPVLRSPQAFSTLTPYTVSTGIPSQLLANRPDIQQAELELKASKLDVKVAKAQFYPSLAISGRLGLQAFNPAYLLRGPESLLYSLAGDLVAPLINKSAIKATYYNANAKQLQAVYNYEQTILNAYIEVVNQLSRIENWGSSYTLKEQEVQKLNQAINTSNNLFKLARADYMEVLLTQRDALESKFELIEAKKKQMSAAIGMYKALGGGWKQ